MIEEKEFLEFQKETILFATFTKSLQTKHKRKFSDQSITYISPSFCDEENRGKSFAYDCISKLQSYCEACEQAHCGYNDKKCGAVDKKLIANCVKMQHSQKFYTELIDSLFENRSNYADFVALLRHRCIKLPLNYLAHKLASNRLLFCNVLQFFICGFGSDELAQSPKEQRKAENVVDAFLKCPDLSKDFDVTNGRLLFDAVLSPYCSAAKMVISDPRIAWRSDSPNEIVHVLKNGAALKETKVFLLHHPCIETLLSEQDRLEIERDCKIERSF